MNEQKRGKQSNTNDPEMWRFYDIPKQDPGGLLTGRVAKIRAPNFRTDLTDSRLADQTYFKLSDCKLFSRSLVDN